MNFLKSLLDHKKQEVAERKKLYPLETMRGQPGLPSFDFASALRRPGLAVIAEIKRKSPSRGFIAAGASAADLASSYRRGGAAALSVLTDEDFFGAAPDDLFRAKEASSLPVLRKDFIIDGYQIHESKHMGADAVLLIAAALTADHLAEYLTLVDDLGMAALVEVHCRSELTRAVRSGATIIGVNNRDLATFDVDMNVCLSLRQFIPPDCIAVAESGIRCRADVARLEAERFDAILIGQSLMEARDPVRLLREFSGGQQEFDQCRHRSATPEECS